jgi:Xaa-Pro aminopeptidase
VEKYRDFGGVRLEDDLLITETGNRLVGDKMIPIEIKDVEEVTFNG